MSVQNFKRTKFACYTAYFTMSSIFSLPPLLFVTFHNTYGISYTLLGTLVLTNFCTQLGIDLIFTVFTKYFNVKKVVRAMPVITCAGMLIYAFVPMFKPEYAYVGLLTGTVIFSVSAGLSEVLLSPVIAAIPSDNPQKDMSLLHSLYAFGVFSVVVISTLFLKIFGTENWMYLTIFFALLPLTAAAMFMTSPMPDMDVSGNESKSTSSAKKRTAGLALCTACIFFGSCAENAMSNWISSYMENALHIDKAMGDILGVAMFAILLGLTRIGYAKYGKNIFKMLLVGMAGAAICYLTAGLAPGVIAPFVACILTGVFTAMLWPGTLIMMEENVYGAEVAAFALMAAGGDLGASIAPQLVGVIIDNVSVSKIAQDLSLTSGLSPEQIGMKAGMLVTSLFPVIGVAVVLMCIKYFKKNKA